MSVCEDVARPLYLELRARKLELWVEDDPKGGPLDYGIEVTGLYRLSDALAEEVLERIRRNEDGLVRVLLDNRDLDIRAVRAEGSHRC